MNKKEKIIMIIRQLCKTVRKQYPQNYDSSYIYDHTIEILMKVDSIRKNSTTKLEEIYLNYCNYICQLQTQISIHNLKSQNII
jgi:hypothetical protein